MKKSEENKEVAEVEEVKFPKSAILKSKRFLLERDVLTAILEEDKEYTIPEVEKLLDTWMKGKVN